MLPPHIPQTPQPKPNVTWTLMAPPQVAFQMWVDGSVRITFAADKAEEVIASFENHLNAFRGMKAMLDNPPKKCVACRGTGQIMVKQGDAKEPKVCPKCSGSGLMNFIPSSVVAVLPKPALPALDEELTHVTLPHESLPLESDAAMLEEMKKVVAKFGYTVVPISKEENAESLARLVEEHKPEPSIGVIDAEEDSTEPPILSLQQLADLGRP